MKNTKSTFIYDIEESLNYLLKNDDDNETKSMEDLVTKLFEKVRKQDDFIYNISHDLRSHLNVILAIMQVINKTNFPKDNEKSIEYLNIIKRNSLKMLRLINNLMDTNKIENNFYVLKKCNLNIVAIIEGTVETVEKYSKGKNIEIIFDTNEEECIMSMDSEVIDRILMNLLSNAIKFSYPNTKIFVTVNVLDQVVEISVKDQGPGICLEDQENIFKRFYRLDCERVEASGSGIGLDLVKQLVNIHEGEIKLNSKEEQGCEFIVILPIKKENEIEDRCIRSNSKIEMLEIEFSDIY